MQAWIGDIEDATKDNTAFRTVLFTGEHTQLTVMCIPPGEDIGREVHPGVDQLLRIEKGHGRLELGAAAEKVDETRDLEEDGAVVVPAGVWHNVVNTGKKNLKLYSLYSPPEHPAGTVHRTKADALAAERATQPA
jgi:mannose-6-phosphate isomerase-like protein (cupin superfamily)